MWTEDLRIAVWTKFTEEWNYTDLSRVDLGDNGNFIPPEDGSPWCRLSITILDNSNAEIGKKYQKVRGIISVQCFSKQKIGEKVTNDMIGEVGNIFQNKDFSGLNCYTMTPVRVGSVENWFQKNAKIDFVYNVFS